MAARRCSADFVRWTERATFRAHSLASQPPRAVLALDRAGGLIRAVRAEHVERAAVAQRENAAPGPAPAGRRGSGRASAGDTLTTAKNCSQA